MPFNVTLHSPTRDTDWEYYTHKNITNAHVEFGDVNKVHLTNEKDDSYTVSATGLSIQEISE